MVKEKRHSATVTFTWVIGSTISKQATENTLVHRRVDPFIQEVGIMASDLVREGTGGLVSSKIEVRTVRQLFHLVNSAFV